MWKHRQLQQPSNLESLATSAVVKWIISLAKPYMKPKAFEKKVITSKKIETVRRYLENVPETISNKLLSELMSCKDFENRYDHLEPNERRKNCNAAFRWVEVLLSKNITSLYHSPFDFMCFKLSFISKSHLLTGVTTLQIECFSLPHSIQKMSTAYDKFLGNIPNIKHLIVTCHSNSLLRCIIRNCKSVVRLDLNDYHYISTVTFMFIIKNLPYVETINLHASPKEYIDAPIKSELKMTTQTLEYILSQKQFVIRSYLILNHIRDEDLLIVIKYPMIQCLKIFKFRACQTLQRCLGYFHHLYDLRELKTVDYCFYADKVKDVIQVVGRKIEKLEIMEAIIIDLEALKFISRMCPHLKELTLIAYRFQADDYVSRKRNSSCITDDVEIPQFKHLKKLKMQYSNKVDLPKSESRPSPSQIIALHVLQNCPNIEYIELTRIDLSNDFFLEVLDKNPLRCLKQLLISDKLDQVIIDRIIENGSSPEVRYW